MRIRGRLFLGTAALVLALTGVQSWLHARQLEDTERAIATVATSVGRGLLTADLRLVAPLAGDIARRVDDGAGEQVGDGDHAEVRMFVVPEGGIPPTVLHGHVRERTLTTSTPDGETASDGGNKVVETEAMSWVASVEGALDEAATGHVMLVEEQHATDATVTVRRFELDVEQGERRHERFLVVRTERGEVRRVPIPVSPTVGIFRETRRQAMLASAALLLIGLIGAAVLSHRLGAPLRDLATRAEELGDGNFGLEIPVTSTGEVGDLQRAFGTMSSRLAELETEREDWRRREHLAQLGDLSRGLAHTLRNPLNTLGLAVEELAAGSGGTELVETARQQIRRIDRWLRSFLALSAGNAAQASAENLGDLVRAVALEAAQHGASVSVRGGDDLQVKVVPAAVRSAIANLVENAVHASPDNQPVEVEVSARGGEAVVSIYDRGPGLPDEVRERLFAPHVTTKVEGSGMGLFLARQLLVNMHGGSLDVEPRAGGGTTVRVRLPLEADGDA